MIRPFVVLDRDGTVITERHYLSDPEQVELIPGAAEGLRRLSGAGFGLVIATNQSAIARGYFDWKRLEEIHARVDNLLEDEGVHLDGIYVCPHLPEDGCDCRKPKTGLIDKAARELGFEPRRSYVIGDKACDLEMGRRRKATTFLVRTGYGAGIAAQGTTLADHVVDTLDEAAHLILNDRPSLPWPISTERSCRSLSERARLHFAESARVKTEVGEVCLDDILAAARTIADCFRSGGKLMLCGNGGSAADCQHMAAEFVSRLTREFDRAALPALALTTDSSFLTAYGNDCGFDGVFQRQVEAFATGNDVLMGISTSGMSTNIVRAFDAAKRKGLRTIALCGKTGTLRSLADVAIEVPSENSQYLQEAHITIEHVLCDLVERSLFSERG